MTDDTEGREGRCTCPNGDTPATSVDPNCPVHGPRPEEAGGEDELDELAGASDAEMQEMVNRARREMMDLADEHEGDPLGAKAGRALRAMDWLRLRRPPEGAGEDKIPEGLLVHLRSLSDVMRGVVSGEPHPEDSGAYPTYITEGDAETVELAYETLRRLRTGREELHRILEDRDPPLGTIVNALRSNVNAENWGQVEEWLERLEELEIERAYKRPKEGEDDG